VAAATTPDAPHLMPGDDNAASDYQYFGYGFQWWVGPREDDRSRPGRDFLAIGVYGQIMYVSPEHGVVVAKNAAYPGYKERQRPGSHENYVETQGCVRESMPQEPRRSHSSRGSCLPPGRYEAMKAIARHYGNVELKPSTS
jgi:CubicO group peptidase (beta-lactamase class C family)